MPGADRIDGEDGIRFARATNDRLAQAVRQKPDRIGGFAHLPMRAPEAAFVDGRWAATLGWVRPDPGARTRRRPTWSCGGERRAQVGRGRRRAFRQGGAPEEVAGKPITPRSDIYAVGVVLYEAVTGHGFAEQGKSVDWSRVPGGLARVLRRAVAENSEGRWQDAAAFRRALERTLAPGRRQVNMIESRKREHSKKPDEQYAIIEGCSPGPYLELFARGTRPGWTYWGSQATEDYRPTWETYAYNSAVSIAAE